MSEKNFSRLRDLTPLIRGASGPRPAGRPADRHDDTLDNKRVDL